jgi:probable F420-dependent oxidoreductase
MRGYLEAYGAAPYKGPQVAGGSVPPVVLAALRAAMTRLAATAADGAFPYLATPSHVLGMRRMLDDAAGGGEARPFLAVTLPVVVNGEAEGARAAARAYLAPYLRTPNYRASWLEQDFAEPDWDLPGSDRLVDAMVAHGDLDRIAHRVREMRDAGADHVALIALSADGTTETNLASLESLAPLLIR